MATREHKGWIWTQEEKQWIKTWERDVQTQYRRLIEQVERFQKAVPGFLEEAAKTAQPFLAEAEGLLTFAQGAARRKYQQLSPNEAKQKLSDVHAHLAAWSEFIGRPDVQAAIRDANRQIDAQKRTQQKQRREARAQMDQKFKTPEFAQELDGYVSLLFEETNEMAARLQNLFPAYIPNRGNINFYQKPFDASPDRPILRQRLQRLLVVTFIRTLYQFSSDVRKAIEPFVHRQPAPNLREVARLTLSQAIQDHWNDFLFATSGSGLRMSIHDFFMVHLLMVFDGLLQSIGEWRKQGIASLPISSDYFTILGVDYSLAAHSEDYPTNTSSISPEAANKLLDSFFEDA